MQQQMPFVGSVTPLHKVHPWEELRGCKTKAHACRVSLIHSGYSQDHVAARMGVTAGYLSMLLSGKRRWTDDMQRRYIAITGSLAPLQWDAEQQGAELHVDPKRAALAQLEAERQRILEAA